MKEFTFKCQQLVRVWEEISFDIEAESYEDAVKQIREMKKTHVYDAECEKDNINIYDNEFVFESREQINPSENNGKPTLFYVDNDGVDICNNVEQ